MNGSYDEKALDADVRRYLELAMRAEEIAVEQAAIKARLRTLGTGTHVAPCGVAVAVAANRRFDPALAERTLPPELLALCRREVVDAKAAKSALPPALYEACMTEVGEARVSVR